MALSLTSKFPTLGSRMDDGELRSMMYDIRTRYRYDSDLHELSIAFEEAVIEIRELDMKLKELYDEV